MCLLDRLPGVRVGRGGGGGAVLGVDGAEGAVDLEEAEHGRGAGAALKPHDERRLGGIHFLGKDTNIQEGACAWGQSCVQVVLRAAPWRYKKETIR